MELAGCPLGFDYLGDVFLLQKMSAVLPKVYLKVELVPFKNK